ncbi:hypothetical protein TEA_016592 [Camellia sinensis var. sinensis]|uniref:Uncharacterized protein n=1 Tax=Camellia sinensis var. sinensis TaxID=542762 RepID=A0A4S4DZS1_CAMSN|nr:hypothetical protein TEA_016592 [Camellia sinensis var. sinensis]
MKHGYSKNIVVQISGTYWVWVRVPVRLYVYRVRQKRTRETPGAEELLPAKLLKRFNRRCKSILSFKDHIPQTKNEDISFFFTRFLYSSLAANDPLRSNDDSSSRQGRAGAIESPSGWVPAPFLHVF